MNLSENCHMRAGKNCFNEEKNYSRKNIRVNKKEQSTPKCQNWDVDGILLSKTENV